MNLCEMRGTQHKNLPFDFESNSLETLMKIVDREGGFTLIPELFSCLSCGQGFTAS